MKIANTDVEAQCPWPEGMYVQGGGRGIVFRRGGGEPYRTAFVEVFPGGTFLRGEGPTVEEAEGKAWIKYQQWATCDGTGEPHGPWEPRTYTNGAGFCVRCGAWASRVLPVQPEPEDYRPGLLERALSGDVNAAVEVLAAALDDGQAEGSAK